MRLTAEAVQSSSLAFQSVDHIHGGDGLSLRVLGVSDGVADHVLQEDFEHSSGLLIDQTTDTFDTSSAGQTSDRGLCYTLDVVAKNFSVTFGASFAQSFTAFASAGHCLKSCLKYCFE